VEGRRGWWCLGEKNIWCGVSVMGELGDYQLYMVDGE
jgi:hypothetical protein